MSLVSLRADRGTATALALLLLLAVHAGHAQSRGVPGETAPTIASAVRTTSDLMTDAASWPDDGSGWQDAAVGLTFSAISLTETSTVPPDASLAAGPTQVVVIANGRLRSFDKVTGQPDGVLNLAPDTFFSSVRSGGPVFGGRVRFDRWTSRWFVTMATDATPSRIVLAVSDTATLTSSTVWRFSGFDNTFLSSTCSTDMPTLAIDSAAVYLGVNQFCGGVYRGTSAFVVRKSSTLAGTLVATAFHDLTGSAGGAGMFAPIGADNAEFTATTGYFAGVDNASFGRLVIRRVNDPGGVPTLSGDLAVTVPATALPVLVPHLGNTAGANGRLSPVDDRLASLVVRNGTLWTVHTIGLGLSGGQAGTDKNGARWYVIDGLAGTPVIAQAGTIATPDGASSSYWNTSLTTTGAGRTVVTMNTAGPDAYISAAATDRASTDATGTMTAPVTWATGTSAYNPGIDPGGATGRRWGRYSETVTDGCDNSTVWALQPVVTTSNTWTLRAARLLGTPPPTLAGVSPSTIPSGEASVTVTVAAGTGGRFADTSAGFLCRLTATIAGVTVTGATVLGDGSVQLTVSTLNAVPGTKAITITNPDGQASTLQGALTVTPGVAMAVDPVVYGQPFVVEGWAFDGRASGTLGVDSVAVYAQAPGGTPVLLGTATLGLARPDVAAVYGSAFAASGFRLRTTTVLPAGPYTLLVYAHSTVTGENALRTVSVTAAAPAVPIGTVDTPADGVTVAGEVGITGWALDAAGIRDVQVYRDAVGSEPAGLVFVGTANFVPGARPDVQAAYPAYPENDRAGWGFMVLTNMLPNSGNGTFRFSVFATNHAGLSTRIGIRTIVAANAGSQIPFGTIDTPGQGADVSGTIVNFGWALTPSPLGIPLDGSTIRVYIDGQFVGHPVYNQYRSDIATLFPGYVNSNGAVGYFIIDTTQLSNGLHSIAWSVQDRAGNVNGIGSRNFRVNNGS